MTSGRQRRLFRLETLVEPVVDPKAISPSCRRHELPEALGAGTGRRQWIESALDHRGEDEILRQPLLLEHIEHHRQVPASPNEPPLDDGTPIPRLELVEE